MLRVLQSKASKLFSPQVDLEDIHAWREHVLSVILLVAVVLGAIVAAPSLVLALSERLWSVAVIDVIALIWVVSIWRARAISFRTRALNFCALLYLLGLSFLFRVGPTSQIYLMAFPLMAALLLGLRPALFALALNAVTLVGVGYLADADLFVPGLEAQPLLKWVAITINFLFVDGLITISSAVLLDGLEKSLGRRRESEELFRTTFENAQVGVSRLDMEGRWLEANRKLCEITGYRHDELLGHSFHDITHPEDLGADLAGIKDLINGKLVSLDREKRYIRKDGKFIWVHMRTSLIRAASGEPKYLVAVATDMTERKQAEEGLHRLAFYDPLTRLPNRRLLLDRLGHALAGSARSQHLGAIMFIDLDNFKTLNDTQGHDVGDRLLAEAALRLQHSVRQGDTVARLGGDEFVVMLENLPADGLVAAQVEAVAEKILATLDRPYQLEPMAGSGRQIANDYRCTASIGVTLFGAQSDNVDELLKQADLAMYRAKDSGRNTIRFFDPDMQATVAARVTLESDLRGALQAGQFLLHYQPQLIGEELRLAGAEALLRWLHPQRGIVSPADFIPLAEETGLILPLGRWVLQTACAQLASWAARPETSHLTIAVNVSARQMREAGFVDEVLSVLSDTGANPHKLKLELT